VLPFVCISAVLLATIAVYLLINVVIRWGHTCRDGVATDLVTC